MIEPFFFNNNQLFGIYHPSSDQSSTKLLVICPPLFDDYRRCYRALSNFSNAMAQKGFHVLRFDFYGTGESLGRIGDVKGERWIEDARNAVEEGIALTGANKVVIAGIRFGATLGAQIIHPSIARYVFWDPFDSGEEYLQWLDSVNLELRNDHERLANDNGDTLEPISFEVFNLGNELKDSLKKLTYDDSALNEKVPVSIVTSSKKTVNSRKYRDCFYPDFEFEWPKYGGGIINPKPVLEAMIERVILP